MRLSYVRSGRRLKRPYDHKLVLDCIKRLLAARAQQGHRPLTTSPWGLSLPGSAVWRGWS
jgi:hypothetical protein